MDNENKQLSIEKDSLRQERDTLLTEKKNTQDEQGASKEAITELSSKVKLHEENLTKVSSHDIKNDIYYNSVHSSPFCMSAQSKCNLTTANLLEIN